MPYYIYKIGHLGILEQMGIAESFKDAKARATELRKEAGAGAPETVRIVFGNTELEAEDLLSRPPSAGPGVYGDD